MSEPPRCDCRCFLDEPRSHIHPTPTFRNLSRRFFSSSCNALFSCVLHNIFLVGKEEENATLKKNAESWSGADPLEHTATTDTRRL